ncbi:MAG: hypothetical protein NTX03_01425 [Bacteroidetes bacterium]|nr:hypothetical protein [Bacteroidota bacterium]
MYIDNPRMSIVDSHAPIGDMRVRIEDTQMWHGDIRGGGVGRDYE